MLLFLVSKKMNISFLMVTKQRSQVYKNVNLLTTKYTIILELVKKAEKN